MLAGRCLISSVGTSDVGARRPALRLTNKCLLKRPCGTPVAVGLTKSEERGQSWCMTSLPDMSTKHNAWLRRSVQESYCKSRPDTSERHATISTAIVSPVGDIMEEPWPIKGAREIIMAYPKG